MPRDIQQTKMTVIPMASDPLAQRLAGLQWPQPEVDRPDPQPGQLWRATWGDDASLVVIVTTNFDRYIDVVAASAVEEGDDSTFVAGTEQGLRPTVWPRLRARIGTFTLDHRLADLEPESFQQVAERVAHPESDGEGAPVTDDLDDRTLVIAELIDHIDALRAAEWLPETAGGEPIETLAALAGFSASSLARELGTSPGDARRLLQGQREPSPAEVDKMAELFGARPGGAASFDPGLIADMDRPQARPLVQHWLKTHGTLDEAAARRFLAGAVLALAARHREPGARNWTALLAEVVDAD